MGNFLNGEISWLVFKVITQRSSYVGRFYCIVIIRIDDNVVDSIAEMIMTGIFFSFGIIKKSSWNVWKKQPLLV